MAAVLIVALVIGGGLGLLGLCAAVRAGQCSQWLEKSAESADAPLPQELRRAA